MHAAPSDPVDFKLLFEGSSGHYLILDPAFRIVAATNDYCRVTHTKREDLIGKHVFEAFTDDAGRAGADGVDNLRASLDRVLATKRPDAMAVQRYDIQLPEEEGGGFVERHWSPLNAPVIGDDGNVRWIIHRVHDVTRSVLEPENKESKERLAREQALVIDRLRAANDELARLDRLRQEMVAMSRQNAIAMMASGLAHDVSQPLTAARNYLAALRRDTVFAEFAEDNSRTLLSKIEAQITRAGEIVKGLRKFMTHAASEHAPQDMPKLVADALALSGKWVCPSSVDLTIDLPPGLPRFIGDRTRVQQLLLNLIHNAGQAVARSAERRVRLAVEDTGTHLLVEISDTGPGLPADVAERLQEPFTTTHLEGGMGLSICRHIAEEHGGKLTARTNNPTGTIFSFTLPLA